MSKVYVLAAGLAALLATGPAHAIGLGEAGEAEAARMRAKAGGPVSSRDAELLERYGCRDKTDSDYCWYLYKKQHGQTSYRSRRRHRH